MPLAATWTDLVIGVCVHWEMIPGPPPFPSPLPNAYVGLICDPIGEALGAAIGFLLDKPPPAPVTINGFNAAITGQSAHILPVLPLNPFHVIPMPPGASWCPPTVPCPSGDADLIFGSETVGIRGARAVRQGDVALNDSDPVPLPFSAVLAIGKGKPVLIGGPPAMDGSAAFWGVVPGVGLSAAGTVARFGRSTRVFRRVTARAARLVGRRGRSAIRAARCAVGFEPIDFATGRVLQSDTDVALPGPLPLTITHQHDSALSWRDGALGRGWSHSLDQAVFFELGQVVYRAEDGRELEYSTLDRPGGVLHPGDEIFDTENEWTLRCTAPFHFEVETKDGVVRELARLGTEGWTAKLVAIRSRDGHKIRLAYDPKTHLLATVHDSVGRRVLFEHDARGRLSRILIPHPKEEHAHVEWRRFEVDNQGDLVAVQDALGRAERFGYRNHLLVERTDRNGARWFWRYDGMGPAASCIETWGEGGIQHGRMTYDKANGTTSVKDSTGRWKRYHYTPDYRITKIVDGCQGEERFEHDEHGRVVAHTTVAGRTTRYQHDARSNVTRIELPGGATIDVAYDARDLPVRLTDPNGGAWTYRYDAQGHRIESTNAAGETTRWEYEHGLMRAMIAPTGVRTELAYDDDKNVATVRSADGVEHRAWYDRLGRVTRRRHPKETRLPEGGRLPNAESRWYDRVGQLAQLQSFDGTMVHLDWDAEGNLVRHHSLYHDIRFSYRADRVLLAREEWKSDERLARVELDHDGDGRLVEVRNEKGDHYRFSHDKRGDLLWEVGWDDGLRRYVRDRKTGELREIWEPSCKRDQVCPSTGKAEIVTDPSGRKTQLDWDAAGRVQRIIHSDGTAVSYRYDAVGAILEATNETGILILERDAVGRVTAERFETRGHPETVVRSAYDLAGDRIQLASSLGHEQHITRGPLGDVVALWAGAPRAHDPWRVHFERDRLGHETLRHFAAGARSHRDEQGGTTVRWQRDLLGRPEKRRTDSATSVLEDSLWKWGTRDDPYLLHLFSADAAAPGTMCFYDERRRLSATRPASAVGEREWRKLDDVGNVFRTPERTDRRYAAGGVLEEADGTRYRHDRDGYLVEKTTPDGKTWRYSWNGHGQLETVALPDDHTVEMAYDPLGRRVAKTLKSDSGHVVRETRWVWDGHVPIHELSSDEEPTTWVFEPESFAPLAKLQGGHSYGIVPDHLGSPHALYDEAGALAWKAQLDVWGIAKTDVAKTRQPWRFPGQYDDEEIGLYYNRFRYYDPQTGRYISCDPLAIYGGLALFGYVPDPTTLSDPLGLACPPSGQSDELTELTAQQIHEWMGRERHHSVFRMLLRAFHRSGQVPSARTAAGLLRPQRLVPLPTSSHRQLHEVWDTLDPNLARGEGASARVADLIRSGNPEYTPSRIMDRLDEVTRTVLADDDGLPDALSNISSVRSRLGI